ncbi:MAG: c-type cytochrome domain-containing protein [Planctomycetota bacterium]|nr:c-type cytochrome domain-containing protein [Planctomycetota bacterium]
MNKVVPIAWVVLAATVSAQEPEPVSYSADVLPILTAHCLGCHQPAKAKGDIVLARHADLFVENEDHGPLVIAGDPGASTLIEVLTGADGEPPAMPEDADPLPAHEIELLRKWIAQGAKDDTASAASDAVSPEHPPTYLLPPVVGALAFSPDGKLIAVAGDHEVLLHRDDGKSLVARLVGLSERIESLAFSSDGSRLAVVGGSPGRFGEVQIWDVAKRSLIQSKLVTGDCLFGVSWSPDGKLLAFGATDTAMRAIDIASGKQVLYQSAHEDWVLDTVFSTDGSHLVSVSRDRSMKLVLVKEEQFIDNITSITPGVLRGGLISVDRHPTKDELLIGGADGQPKLFRMYREKKRKIGDNYNRLRVFEKMPGRVFAVEFRADGKQMVAASSHRAGGVVRVCDVENGKTLWTREMSGGIYTAGYRPDGAVIGAAGFGGMVYLLDAKTGKTLKEFLPVPIASASTPQEQR